MANKKPNTDSLVKFAKEKSDETIKKVNIAIKKMIKNQVSINFNSVANEAGVSKAFLYKNDDIKSRIIALRKQQEGVSSPKNVKRNLTDSSKDVLIETLKKKIEVLEEENKDLKRKLNSHYVDIYTKTNK